MFNPSSLLSSYPKNNIPITDIHPTMLGASSNPLQAQTAPIKVSHATISLARVHVRPCLDLPSLFPPQGPSTSITKRILEIPDVQLWLHSEAFVRILWFLQSVNLACSKLTCTQARELFTKTPHQDRFRNLLAMFEKVSQLVTETPPEPLHARYGNRAFRTFMEKLSNETPSFHRLFLDMDLPEACLEELFCYFRESFGNTIRIDYGTGHELAFLCWITCLDLLDVFGPADDNFHYAYLGLVVFDAYLKLVRRIQKEYSLEPAGSHGVWGLDDFQFIPYFWGAAQLIDHPRFKPSIITNQEIIEHFAGDYLYFQSVAEIYHSKKGPFFEHSPMLYDISGVQTWHKVNTGMQKMYIAEVCSKFPIVQHMHFGVLLPFREVDPDPHLTSDTPPHAS